MNLHVVKAAVQLLRTIGKKSLCGVSVGGFCQIIHYPVEGNQACNHKKIKDVFPSHFSVLDRSLHDAKY